MSKKKSYNLLEDIKERFVKLKRLEMGEIPMNILETMDIIYKNKEHEPVLIIGEQDGKVGVRKYSGGWHFIFTMNPGCDFDYIKSHQSMFQSVVRGTVEIERRDKFLHIDVNDFQWEKVYPFSLITDKQIEKCSKMYMPMCIGVKTGGKLKLIDMEEFSHVMLGGVNNSGKSVWLRQQILFVKKYFPYIKVVYIDFMRLDAKPFKDITYLGRNIEEAKTLLRLVCAEANRRLDILEDADCSKASEYNEYYSTQKLHPLLVAIDELKELEDKECQQMLQHLAMATRKCGVHLITSLQRPSHTTYKNFTDSRSQFPARLCFKMADRTDSELILGNNKASLISGKTKGRAIWQYDKEYEIQSLYIDNKELREEIRQLNMYQNQVGNINNNQMPKSNYNSLQIDKGGNLLYDKQQSFWLSP